jgi:putative oxidoreductase
LYGGIVLGVGAGVLLMIIAYTIGRILIPLLFLVNGIQKAFNVGEIARMLEANNIPIPEQVVPYLGSMPKYEALGYLIAAIEIICGLMVLIGLKARWAALVLIVFAACTIIFVYPFWTIDGQDAQKVARAEALKIISIIGGLLLVVAVGSRPEPPLDR